jgi:putative membrane protein
MKRFLSQIVSAVAGLWIASYFIPEVAIKAYADSSFFGFSFTQQWQIFLLLGIILGLLNFFVRPILKAIALPLEIITLGLFTLVINMGLIWFLDLMFDELYAPWMWPLIYTTLIIWGLELIISKIILKDKD